MTKKKLSILGLVFITFISAIQYPFLEYIPDSLSTFAFICLTNLVGFLLMGILQFSKLITITRKTVFKGSILALELIGFNVFILLGSRGTDTVVISSVSSMAFVFVTPMLLILRKKVSFFSHIASIIAVISLLLMLHIDPSLFAHSSNVLYLIIEDLFFALYVVSVSEFCKNENPVQLTLMQMVFSMIFSFAGWMIETAYTHTAITLPKKPEFWICVIFMGIFIRAVYSLIQMTCQKYVSALPASLIFSSEVVITLLINPIRCILFHTEYTPASVIQYIGCALFIVAIFLVDDNFMRRLGFKDIDISVKVDDNGKKTVQSSIARKIIMLTINISMSALLISSLVGVFAIQIIRDSVVYNLDSLGEKTSRVSEKYLTDQLEDQLTQIARDKADFADLQLYYYTDAAQTASSFAESLHADPEHYPEKEVSRPKKENKGSWRMSYVLSNKDISYDNVIDESKLLGNMFDVFKPVIKNNSDVVSIYYASTRGILVSYNKNPANLDDDEENYYDFRKSSWYRLAREKGTYVFTEPYEDYFGQGLVVTCASPVYDKNGKFIGCVGVDIQVDELNNSMVSDDIASTDSATLIDREGNIIAGDGINEGTSDTDNIFDSNTGSNLRDYGDEILSKKNGIILAKINKEDVYIVYATVDITDWTLCITSPVSSVIKPVITTRKQIDEDTDSVVQSVEDIILYVFQVVLILIVILLLITILCAGKLSDRISLPLKQLGQDVRKISSGDFTQRTQVQTNDEIGILANSFNSMSESLEKYIDDLKEAMTREQKTANEMALAAKIQADMLPRAYPAFPDHEDFDIFATMTPAKEVGGDFYDYFLLDEDHIVLVMADVSGKGVPAALFMVISKTMIKNGALVGGSPSQIMSYVNNQLCEGNDEDMFVTVWLAIIELSTGKVSTVNAGHECPVIKRKDGRFEIIKKRHGMALAAMEGLKYRENEFQIYPGDRIYIYTDGVPEATNASDEMYGVDRMLDSLNQRKDASQEEILYGLKEDIDSFVGDAPQFDDITMLIFDYFGRK